MEHFSLHYKWDHRFSTLYYPQGNGIAERAVKSCISLLQKRIEGNTDSWSNALPSVQLGINQNNTSIHGSAPFSLMFARKLNPFNNFSSATLSAPSSEEVEKRAQFIQNILFPSIAKHSNNVIAQRNKSWNARKNTIEILPVGTVVMVRIVDTVFNETKCLFRIN